jgi:ankyrin repeat protein
MTSSTSLQCIIKGYTALHLASDRGNIAVVKLLLERGANAKLQARAQRYTEDLTLILCRMKMVLMRQS